LYRIYENQLQLDLYKSRCCYLYLLVTGSFVVAALILISLTIYLKLLIVFFVSILFGYYLRHRHQVISIKWYKQNRWVIFLRQGLVYKASLLNNSFITRFICVLNFKLESGMKFSYVIFPDSLHHEQMRRLLVRMKVEHSDLFSK